MAEAIENPDTEKSTSDFLSGLTYQSITDNERQTAVTAYKQFQLADYTECIKSLHALESTRPQDAKVFHNLYVTEYYQSKCRKFADLYSNLLLVCKQANIEVEDIDSIDDVDQCVVFFNRAIILYHLHKYRGAICILDKVFQFIEPLDEVFGKQICLLLLELYLCTNQPKKALRLIGYIEAMLISGATSKTSKTSEKDEASKEQTGSEDLKLKLALCKARCYTMLKTAKPCKREVKTLMLSGSKVHHISALVIKSQLEYLRGNYRKAIRMLNSPEWPTDYSKYFLETGDCLQTIYYNNMGCIHYYMGKPNLGAFYIERAVKELDGEVNKLKEESSAEGHNSQPLHTLSTNIKKKLIYNLAMQFFQQQKYHKAFKMYLDVSEYFFDNPRLWLRIAECCIQIHRQNNSGEYKTVKAVIGANEHRKIILNPSQESPAATKPIVETLGVPEPTLSFAVCALRNSLMLLPKDPPATASIGESLITTQSTEEKDAANLEENSVPASPSNAIPFAEIQSLRNTVLIDLAYVSLRVGDLILAHSYATQLLAQPRASEAHKYLAHMYAGEALVYLDKISQAVEHFNPELFNDISQTMPAAISEEQILKHQVKADTPERSDDTDRYSRLKPAWQPENLQAAQLMAQYNLAVVYALRGEWSKALNLVSEIINEENAPPQAKSLIVYIHLCKGATDVALSYLNESLPAHQRLLT